MLHILLYVYRKSCAHIGVMFAIHEFLRKHTVCGTSLVEEHHQDVLHVLQTLHFVLYCYSSVCVIFLVSYMSSI